MFEKEFEAISAVVEQLADQRPAAAVALFDANGQYISMAGDTERLSGLDTVAWNDLQEHKSRLDESVITVDTLETAVGTCVVAAKGRFILVVLGSDSTDFQAEAGRRDEIREAAMEIDRVFASMKAKAGSGSGSMPGAGGGEPGSPARKAVRPHLPVDDDN